MYSPKKYWTDLAERYHSADSSGFAPVLHPLAPPWFNRAIDEAQCRAVHRALALADLVSEARFLDVGCGTGRWLRRYLQQGFHPVGVDATLAMLHIARAHRTTSPLAAGLAYHLPFADNVFDCISDITVIQHIPYQLQPEALREMIRVLKPGGKMILFELIRGSGPHIFPRQAQDWIEEVQRCGAILMSYFGQEYFFLDRAFVRLVQTLRRSIASGSVSPTDRVNEPRLSNDGLIQRLYWQTRRITVPISVWMEPLLTSVFSCSMATHAVFIFRK